MRECGILGGGEWVPKKIGDLSGMRFGKWLVEKEAEPSIDKKGTKHKRWWCLCDCGCRHSVDQSRLITGRSKSCGDCVPHSYKQYNKYEITDEYVIGYTAKGDEFYLDKEDLPLVMNYTWYITEGGYVRASKNNAGGILMHDLIMNPPKGMVVDHIGHQRNNNCKKFLRLVTPSQNTINSKVRSDNRTTVTGVHFEHNKYRVRIVVNGKNLSLGMYDTLEEAAAVRKIAEEKYYGKHSYQNSMAYAQQYALPEQQITNI